MKIPANQNKKEPNMKIKTQHTPKPCIFSDDCHRGLHSSGEVCWDEGPELSAKDMAPALTEEQRDIVFRAAGYAHSMVKLPKSKVGPWIDAFSGRLKSLTKEEC